MAAATAISNLRPELAANSTTENKSEPNSADMMPWLKCQLSLEIPVAGFTVGDLLRLAPGSIVETSWQLANDIPLRANGELIAWAEFEVTADQLALRITELA